MSGHFKFAGDKDFKKEIADLQGMFASQQFSDELRRMARRKRRNKTSITRDRGRPLIVKQLLAIRFRIDGSINHKLPHLHVNYGDNHHAAIFAIETGEKLAGKLNRKYDKPAREWVARNKRKLLNVRDFLLCYRAAWKSQSENSHSRVTISAPLDTASKK